MDRLTLEITRYQAPHQWYWSLSDSGGAFITDHEACLDPAAPQFEAFTRLDAFLPRLRKLMELHAILVVIDGVDDLLTTGGSWRDSFWGRLTDAMLSHRGFSRLILTGRRPVAALPRGLAVEQLGPLTPRESVLLARQLPVLGSLIRGTGGIPMGVARRVLAGTLTAADGNPGAIRAREEELREAGLDRVATGAASAEYAGLVERWTYELD